MIRLGVNIDHVATVRNARGESYPSPLDAASLAQVGGADNITAHLREDRRHIRDRDIELLRETIHVPLNFEMAATDEMVAMAERLRPHAVSLVPERRQEVTTEGGLDVAGQKLRLLPYIKRLSGAGILVSLFIEPERRAIELSREIGADAVEFHTGAFCSHMAKARRRVDQLALVQPLIDAAGAAHGVGLQVHVGHGLNYANAHWLQLVPHCEEANIGHAIVGRAVMVGMVEAVREMKALINDPRYHPRLTCP